MTTNVHHSSVPGSQGPEIRTAIPGPRSRELAHRLEQVESRNVTCLEPDVPIFWDRAQGVNVWDVDGNRFVDLGGAFGVANVGHAHPEVATAVAVQAGELLHGMGDVHPPTVKVELLEALCARFPGGGEARGVLVSSGSDAVEVALKTAQLATGRPGVIAFEGGYHGLTFGALDTTWREDFRAPFAERLANKTGFARYGDAGDVARVRDDLAGQGIEVGAVLVEPVQGRGGERIPPHGFLGALREQCSKEGWLLIADEVYTGFGRTGSWFACEHEHVEPDLLCIGKGMSSGMPIAACLGRRSAMDAWPASAGEALHTQTFLGHPASCAAALASMQVLEAEALVERSADTGREALAHMQGVTRTSELVREVRGLGLMLGIECANSTIAAAACRSALEAGFIALPSGEGGRVVSLTPPLCIDSSLLHAGIDVLAKAIG